MSEENTEPAKDERTGRKYRTRRRKGEDSVTRLTISLPQKEKDAFKAEAFRTGVTLSKFITDVASGNFASDTSRLLPKSPVSSDDLEFMTSIVKTVGVPLTLEELLLLLQKHKSKEVSNG